MAQLIPLGGLLFEAGDRLSRDEFLLLWEQMPELKRAELIDGVVYLPSPVSVIHSGFEELFTGLLWTYRSKTPGCQSLPNATWLMLESAPQPDVALCVKPEYGGRVRIKRDLASGAPELAIEVTRSTRSYDLGPKLALYQEAGVQEYVTALTEAHRIEWRVLEAGSYRMISPDSLGVFRSRIFPGLWIDSKALWREDQTALLATLEQGLDSAEHAEFVERLRAAKK